MKHFAVAALLLLAALVPRAAYPQAADEAMAIAQRAVQLQQAGDYPAAVDAYRAFLKLRPNEPAARSNLGAALVKLGRYDEAIEEYREAEKLLPGDPRIGMNLALAYEKSGRVREAAEKLTALHAGAPQEKQITLLLADCELQSGEYDQVISLLQPVERENPSDLAAAYMLGTALIRTRHTAEGQVLLDKILRNGDSAEARFLVGTQSFESGDFPAAVKELARAVELNPKLPQLQSYYGLALLNTGDPVGAVAALRSELAQNPNDYSSNLALGQILIVSKQYAEATPRIEAALRRRPDSIEAGLALGECLSGMGKLQDARIRLEAVTRAVPASLEAHRELLSVYTRLRMKSQAARERALVDRLEREAATKEGGPPINAFAPDFDLSEVGTNRRVRLSDLRGKTPVVLAFGSYSCPNLRASAEALNAMFQHYGEQARFFLVYIREAHATGDWQSTRNVREGITVAPALTMEDKVDHAVMCTRKLHLKFPALVDGMDGRAEATYAAWPSRAFVIGRDGRVRYGTGLSQQDFHAEAMQKALRAAIARP
ncbi:MAG: tetratricopeptide repeat protein [Acidobacteriia bacterium]|nr:tetratricopeptide repeat protein [Terriglobia bacterium]